MRNFKEELIKNGMASTRAFDTALAVRRMHEALCMMDFNNRLEFLRYVERQGGLLGTVQRYAELEDLNRLS